MNRTPSIPVTILVTTMLTVLLVSGWALFTALQPQPEPAQITQPYEIPEEVAYDIYDEPRITERASRHQRRVEIEEQAANLDLGPTVRYAYSDTLEARGRVAEAMRGQRLAEEREAARVAAREQVTQQPTQSTPAPAPQTSPPPTGDVWWSLALCESGGQNVNTGNGYYGYFQFLPSTWTSVGGPGMPHEHSYDTQRHYAQVLQARSGWSQWPACSRKLGLR